MITSVEVAVIGFISFSFLLTGCAGYSLSIKDNVALNGKCKIIGKIIDEANGEPIISANVVLRSTSIGAATDVNGCYETDNVPPGIYTIQVTYIGYKSKQIPNIEVKANREIIIDIKLEAMVDYGQID
jgi:hypothetical protein